MPCQFLDANALVFNKKVLGEQLEIWILDLSWKMDTCQVQKTRQNLTVYLQSHLPGTENIPITFGCTLDPHNCKSHQLFGP